MKKTTTILIMTFLFSLTATSQNNFDSLWTKVEKLEIENLPKSALKTVDEIYMKATKEENSTQLIKSLFYKSKFSLILEEDAQLKVINSFKKHILESEFPTKNVLENILANLYWQYFNQNRYKFYNRTHTSKISSEDFTTWDLNTLFKEIHLHFNASLKDEKDLQKIEIEVFADILQLQKDNKTYSPTLYDFLANNALNFYKSSETSITRPSYKFSIDNEIFSGKAKVFSTLKIASKDSISLQLNALKTYQKLISFHLKENTKNALAAIDIERLKFVNQNASFQNNETLLLETLKSSKKENIGHESEGLYAFEIAQIYFQKANYKEKENQFKNKKALEICDAIIAKYSKSLGATKCAILKSKIEEKSLSIKAEEFVPIQSNSRVLISYKNIDKLYFTAYKITEKQYKEYQKTYKIDEKITILKKFEQTKNWSANLRNEHDYLNYTTEVIVPKLANGFYLILTSEKESLDEKSIFGTTTLQVTNLSLITNTFNNTNNYQIVDRNNGKPIKNASIHLNNKGKRNGAEINKKLTTDKNGFASFKSLQYYQNIVITVNTNNDNASFGNHYLYNQKEKNEDELDEEILIKPFIFTDRSIYRPGQTIYFKAIVIQKKGKKSDVLKDKFVSITLEDTNGQEVKTLDLKLNEFGSVASEFILPNNGLTGEFTITIDESEKQDVTFYDKVDFDYTTTYISVEEYKRPKFKTEFNPVTESIKLNDSVTVKGFAKAFSGANITDAKVVYRVRRNVQLPNWYYWRNPYYYGNSQEITNGESITDASGHFSIMFKTLPDTSVSKESLPVFNYEITADVTDVNGETRSATTVVKVGYHSLLATISIDDKIDKNQKETILKIDTKNLNDEFVAAKGTIKIYKLQAPKNPLRKRPWSAPDYQDISENEFRKRFPNEPFLEDENNSEKWKKGTLVFSKDFDTSNTKEIELESIKKWVSGKYIAVLESEDKFGQEVKDEKKFSIYSTKEKQVTDNRLFTINTDKTFYKVGDDVKLQIGSASKDITVVVQIERNQQIIETCLIKLKNNTKTIKIPIKKDDVGGFAVKYHYVNFNDFESGSLLINVLEKPISSIEIETNIFRDKLQPGTEETWSFTIKNDKNDAVSAELLASMYDASLDVFKLHNWQFNPILQKQQYYSYQTSTANQSFGVTNFNISNNYRNYYGFPSINNAEYNWFGFSLNKNNWLNNQYLRSTKRKLESTRTDFDGTITGVVEDNFGSPLPGVSIFIKETSYGTETDFDGNYSIKIKKGDVLVFNYIGFSSKEIIINEQNLLDVVLTEDANALDEVVVVGYGTQKRKSITGAVNRIDADALEGKVAGVEVEEITENVPFVQIRGASSNDISNYTLYVVDGVIVDKFDINQNEIAEMSVLKDSVAKSLYGARATNGVVIITTKSGLGKLDKELFKIKARKNFKETAFFFPQLQTDKNGKVSFTFTMPEALTRWKLQLLAHTTELKSATKTLQTITQKELMVVPNAPRFLREGDKITLSAKITNLTNNKLSGIAKIYLTDAITGKSITKEVLTDKHHPPLSESSGPDRVSFTVDSNGNTNVFWDLKIPETVQAIQYKIVAQSGSFSDGEQNVLPVLSNRMLVTETLPMWVRSNETKTFTLDKLKNNNSSTLKNHQLTLEMTSNPVWYAIQSLPYLMEYPYECAEQTFSKYYANTLASFVANSNPRIQEVFNIWKNSDALISNLEKNEELKLLIIQETPWLRDAQSETEQKKRIALLFDLNKMKNEQEKSINKLKEMQMNSGGFPWFKGGNYESNFITQHIATGFGHLQKLGVSEFDVATQKMIEKAISYLDGEIIKQYESLIENAKKLSSKKEKAYLEKNHLTYFIIQYLYMRSYFTSITMTEKLQKAVDFYQNQTTKYWNDFNLYAKGQIALSLYRNDEKTVSNKILKSLKENSITSDELGMYWKDNNAGYQFYEAPVETQVLLIEVFSELENDAKTIDNLKIWLLKNKQTNRWKTTKATTEAVYALLLNGSDWVSITEMVDIKVGDKEINPAKLENVKVEAGTGYFKTSWNTSKINPKMSEVTITKKGNGIAWGGLYWQYFEDLDKITSAETPLKINKKLFLKLNSDTGKELQEITNKTKLKVGDLITIKIELKSDRDMEFIHMKDMRASGVEPINVRSTYKWQDNLGYYKSTKDAATNFFFDRIPKGVYVFEYDVRVNNAGNFSNGITTIQSMYAPEFSSHSKGIRLQVEK